MSTKRKNVAPFINVLLESNSAVPLYRQIYETLRRQILSGNLPAESKMPSTRLLADQLAVSRMTVINAYELLLAEGYIEGVSGSGTFVAKVLPETMLETGSEKNDKGKTDEKESMPALSKRGRILASFNHTYLRASRTDQKFSAFHPGIPAMDAFPFDIWSRLVSRRLKQMRVSLFGSGNPVGYEPLRRAIAAYLQTSRAVRCQHEQIFIVAGAQQALALIARVLIDEGDAVWMEDPGHLGTRNVFAAAGARVVSVPIDAEGFDLQHALKENKNARLACVTPSHQFPLGTVMSLARRLALLNWAKTSNSWIVEDDYDSEFRYAGRPLPCLQGLEEKGASRVIYVGTFSLTIFQSLRLGYMVVPENLIDAFTAARALADSHSPSVDQAVLTDFIEEGHFPRHLRKMRSLYAERQATLITAAENELADFLEIPADNAGMHLIAWLPAGTSDKIAVEKALAQGVVANPLSAYSTRKMACEGLILGYTAFSLGQIRNGVARLAKAFR